MMGEIECVSMGHGSVVIDCAGGCGAKVRRHPQRAKKVSFSVCGPKCRAKVNGKQFQKVTDEQVIVALLEHVNVGRTKKELSDELGISPATFNARIRKLQDYGSLKWHSSVGHENKE